MTFSPPPLDTPNTKTIKAQPGPQSFLLSCPAFEILMGGARGGGKTYSLILDWLAHATRYGSDAHGIVFRRHTTEFTELLTLARMLLQPIGWEYKESKSTWIGPNGSDWMFRYLEHDRDVDIYKGFSRCVAVGTKILMGDGTYQPIETIVVGDLVQTLEGPQPVVSVFEPFDAKCVEARIYGGHGELLGTQCHPVTHPVYATVSNSCLGLSRLRLLSWLNQASNVAWLSYESLVHGHPETQATFVSSKDAGSDCKGSLLIPLTDEQLGQLSSPVVLYVLQRQLKALDFGLSQSRSTSNLGRLLQWFLGMCKGNHLSLRLGQMRAALPTQSLLDRICDFWRGRVWHHVAPKLEFAGFLGGCPGGNDLDGESQVPWLETYLEQPLQPTDAGGPSHSAARLGDVVGKTHIHSQVYLHKYVHPYSGQARSAQASVVVGKCLMRPCGIRKVMDLCVQHANHYITESGLINKNSHLAVDEIADWPFPEPLDKLRAIVRSAVPGMKCRMLLTGNPGSRGHEWCKERYIDPAPPLTIFTNRFGLTQCYIPSTIRDNPALLENDPLYINRLRSSGPAWLVRAWLEGDWNVVMEGKVFKRDMLYQGPLPKEVQQRLAEGERAFEVFDYVCHAWDTAIKTKQENDYSACLVIGKYGAKYYILDAWRGKLPFGEVKQMIKVFYEKHGAHRVVIEDKGSGESLLQELYRDPVIPTPLLWPAHPKGIDKIARAHTVTPVFEAGLVVFPLDEPKAGDVYSVDCVKWLQPLMNELLAFQPDCAHDDFCDALIYGVDYLIHKVLYNNPDSQGPRLASIYGR